MVEMRIIPRTFSVVLCAGLLAACAGQPTAPDTSAGRPAGHSPPVHNTVDPVTRLALSLVGTPYRYGGATPEGFDCSGLVFYAYTSNGFDVPRTSLEQFKAVQKIRLDAARPGDLVFFQDEARLSHVGIYLGADRFVHAPASGREVSISRLSEPYYQTHLVAVGRLVNL